MHYIDTEVSTDTYCVYMSITQWGNLHHMVINTLINHSLIGWYKIFSLYIALSVVIIMHLTPLLVEPNLAINICI